MNWETSHWMQTVASLSNMKIWPNLLVTLEIVCNFGFLNPCDCAKCSVIQIQTSGVWLWPGLKIGKWWVSRFFLHVTTCTATSTPFTPTPAAKYCPWQLLVVAFDAEVLSRPASCSSTLGPLAENKLTYGIAIAKLFSLWWWWSW